MEIRHINLPSKTSKIMHNKVQMLLFILLSWNVRIIHILIVKVTLHPICFYLHLYVYMHLFVSYYTFNIHQSLRRKSLVLSLPIFFRLNHFLTEFNPISYHIVNVLLHAAVTGLFTQVCLSVLRLSVQGATIAGLLFAAHPIHTEAVSTLG